MKEIAKFTVGSFAFFRDFPGFAPHDIDTLHVMSDWRIPGTTLAMRKNGKDDLFVKNMDKDALIAETLRHAKAPMKAGKFLVKEYAEYLKMTVDDLKKLEPLFRNMDEKHKYETLIYDFYMENGEFKLSEKQLEEAYSEYRRLRPEGEPRGKTA